MTSTTDPVKAETGLGSFILLLALTTFTSMVGQRICDAMLPEFTREFHVSLSQAAATISLFAVAYGLGLLPAGILADRWGKGRVLTGGIAVFGLASATAAQAGTFEMLLLARCFMGIASAAMIPVALAWLADTAPPQSLQIRLTYTGMGSTMGLVIGQFLGGAMTESAGWRSCFAVLALAAFALSAACVLRRKATAAITGSQPISALVAPSPKAWMILRQPHARIVLIISTLEGAVTLGVLGLWPTHLHDGAQASLSQAGGVVALFGVGGLVYMALGVRLIARISRSAMLVLGGSLCGTSTMAMAWCSHLTLACAISLIAGFGFSMFHNTMQWMASNIAPASRAVGVSLFATALLLGQSVGLTVAVAVATLTGSSSVIFTSGLIMVVLGHLFGRAIQRTER
jgi:MFS transporter, YNFM family, putative membrane transport protein